MASDPTPSVGSAKGHIATCAIISARGNRVGTRYIYTADEVRAYRDTPWFRWRNEASLKAYRAALSPSPTAEGGER